jgi:hypothetical protein
LAITTSMTPTRRRTNASWSPLGDTATGPAIRSIPSSWISSKRLPSLELKAAGIPVLATYVTETASNNYPQLPIRADRVFVWLTRFADRADYDRRMGVLRNSPRWSRVGEALRRACTSAPEVLHLQPTHRSRVGG